MDLDTLRGAIDKRAPAGTTEPLPGVFLSRETEPGVPRLSTTGTCVALVVQGAKRLTLGTQVIDYGPGDYLVTSVDLPVVGHFTKASSAEPALGFGMTLSPTAIAEVLLAADPSAFPAGHRASRAVSALSVAHADEDLLDAVGRLLRLLDRPRDLPILGPMVQREILWLLLTGPHGEAIRQLGLPASRLTPISHAVAWIRQHPADPMRVEELAERVGLSVSAFHRTFRAVTGSSPLQFHKQLRLQTARQLLIARPVSVGQIAADVGYESTTQFNRDYRRQFGASPGRHRAAVNGGT